MSRRLLGIWLLLLDIDSDLCVFLSLDRFQLDAFVAALLFYIKRQSLEYEIHDRSREYSKGCNATVRVR